MSVVDQMGIADQTRSHVAVVDVGAGDTHTVLLRVGDELRRSIKPHRLTVQQCRTKRSRIMTFQKAGGVDQQCEARRVRFWEPVFAKALNLVKDLLSKLSAETVRRHA